jgi:hypothetical protein
MCDLVVALKMDLRHVLQRHVARQGFPDKTLHFIQLSERELYQGIILPEASQKYIRVAQIRTHFHRCNRDQSGQFLR